MSSIKKLGNLVYGFRSYPSNGVVYEYINSNGDLILLKNGEHIVASNVVYADLLLISNNSEPWLYFIRDNGTVGVVKNIAFIDTQDPIVEDVTTTSKALFVKNVSNPEGLHKVVIVDIDGNFIDL